MKISCGTRGLIDVFPFFDPHTSLPCDAGVERKGLNFYSFTYRNKEVGVDLNLPESKD
ncbi:hypothetical protein S1OALGB6SA_1491 [Olavius algarvensis spirochete endosymbiont]|nr:hypothetical protein S1OALGB6SA_1491 [Olavius algarvensis spirochete endosymbiont]